MGKHKNKYAAFSFAVAPIIDWGRPYTGQIKKELAKEQNWRCYYCGEKKGLAQLTIDHKTPRSRGGSDLRENLCAACRKCNQLKDDKTELEFKSPANTVVAEGDSA